MKKIITLKSFFTKDCMGFLKIRCLAKFFMFFIILFACTCFCTQGQHITITGSATNNGSWSAIVDGTYTFTPDGITNANIKSSEISERLNGLNGFVPGHVLVKTAGNITVSQFSEARNTSRQFRVLELQAGGEINVTVNVDLMSQSGGYSHHIKLKAVSNISVTRAIKTFGEGYNSGWGGGQGGDVVLISENGDIKFTSEGKILSYGGNANSNGMKGGNGGSLRIEAGGMFQSGGNSNSFECHGGEGQNNADGGNSGNIFISAGTIDCNGLIQAKGSKGLGNGNSGGLGGDVILLSAGNISVSANINTSGGNGSSGAAGGAAGTISIQTEGNFSSTVSGALTAGGGEGESNANGGNGGDISITGAYIDSKGTIQSRGNKGTNSGNRGGRGGNVSFLSSGNILQNGNIEVTGGNGVSGAAGGQAGTVRVKADGDFSGIGALTAIGGDINANANGGSGGNIFITASNIECKGSIQSKGNKGLGTGNSGGAAGNVTLLSQENIIVSASIDATGGSGESGSQGGNGGEIMLEGGNSFTGNTNGLKSNGGDGLNSGNGGRGGNVTITAPMVSILGFYMESKGGNGHGEGKAGAAGGNISITAVTDIIINSTQNLDISGGRGNNGAAGADAGNISIYCTAGSVAVPAIGTWRLNGGNDGGTIGGNGGNIIITAHGDVSFTGTNNSLELKGGYGGVNGLAGHGGDFIIQTDNGNVVFTGFLDAKLLGGEMAGAGCLGGNGGSVLFRAENGYIKIKNGLIASYGTTIGTNGNPGEKGGDGGHVEIFGAEGVTIGCEIRLEAGNYNTAAAGTYGDLIIGCHNNMVTTGFDGHNSGAYEPGKLFRVGKVTKTGTGTVVLLNNSDNEIKGQTRIANGTLLLKSEWALPKNRDIVLDGGVLGVENLRWAELIWTGKLYLTSSGGGIMYADGETKLKFPAYGDGDWHEYGTLVIRGWTDVPDTPGKSGNFFMGNETDRLPAGQCGQVLFILNGDDYYNAATIANGEVVPTGAPKDLADTIVWNNNAENKDWNIFGNWDVKNGASISGRGGFKLSGKAVAVIPKGVNGYPEPHRLPSFIRCSDDKHVSRLVVEHGASIFAEAFKGKYDSVEVHLEVTDRQKWMLTGPNIMPGFRQMVSGDFFLNYEPQVYMHEFDLDKANGADEENISELSWKASFSALDIPVMTNKCFAIRVPDQYGSSKRKARFYFRDNGQPDRMGEGVEPVLFRLTGQLQIEDESAATFSVDPDRHAVISNIFLSDVCVTTLLSGTDDEVMIWNHANESFDTYNASRAEQQRVFIRPMQAFIYKNQGTAAKDITLNERVCIVNPSGMRYARAHVQELTIQASAENQGRSYAYFLYDEENNGKNTSKLFTGVLPNTGDHAPDIFSYTTDRNYQGRVFNDMNSSFGLGIRVANPAEVTLSFEGTDMFDEVYLDDKEKDITYDLKTTDSLSVELPAGENKGRFVLRFYSEDVGGPITHHESPDLLQDIEIYTEANKQLIISSELEILSVQVVNISGLQVISKSNMGKTYCRLDMSGYPVGVYVVKATTNNGVKTGKVSLK